MSLAVLFVAAAVMVPAFGLAAWMWSAATFAEEELRSSQEFEGMHFYDSDRGAARTGLDWRAWFRAAPRRLTQTVLKPRWAEGPAFSFHDHHKGLT